MKTRLDTLSRLRAIQQEAANATVNTMHDLNKLVAQCVKDSWLTLTFVPVRYWDGDFKVFAVNGSAFMNMKKDVSELPEGQEALPIECQQGHIVLCGNDAEETGRPYPFNPVVWGSHKGRRKSRSTLGAESGAASDGMNAAELVRGYFAEVLLGRRLCLRPYGLPL